MLVFALTAAALVVGLLGIARMNALNNELATMRDQHVESMGYLSEARGNLALMWRGMFVHQISAAADKPAQVTVTAVVCGGDEIGAMAVAVTIASAVEEQTATTSEMSRSVGDASSSTASIAANITGVADAAQSTTSALGRATDAVERLGQASSELQTVVGRFRM